MRQVSEVELVVVLRWLAVVLRAQVGGDVVEMGCYRGETSVELGERLVGSGKDLWVYDSFEGLPEGGEMARGELKASAGEVISRFRKRGLTEPYVVKGWFAELSGRDMPEEICFAFLDGDFYGSIADSLKLVGERMARGGVVLVHDYANGRLPGVRRAVSEYAAGRGMAVRVEGGMAVLRF